MAFLCPVRMRRDKKKGTHAQQQQKKKQLWLKTRTTNLFSTATNANIERDLAPVGMGRITGSSSIETLVRVGIEKEHGLRLVKIIC